MLPLSPPPKKYSPAPAVIMTAAVLKSRDRGIWPFFRASSNRLGVALSVFSVPSSFSAMEVSMAESQQAN
jgi:hypothetical protein